METAALASGLQQRFLRDGLLFPLPALASEETRRFRAACDRLEARLGAKPRTIEVRQMHLHLRWAYELATTPRILDAAQAILGEDLLIWATELFAKHPHDSAVSIAWHRDKDYMGFDSLQTLTAWVALSNCNEANGCMKAVPGPGRHAPAPSGAPRAETCVLLRPGEMSLHDSEILHGSGPNLSAEKRVGFAIRYVAPTARPRHGRPPVVLARGRDPCGFFQLVDPPGDVNEDEALAALRRSALLHFDAVLRNLSDRGTAEGRP